MPLPVRIVTDSTSNLPRELLEQYAIGVVPVLVIFGRQTYRENVDITLPEFYDRVERTGEVPSASQPSPGAFVDVYTKLLQEAGDCQLLSIHLTGRLSGVLASARLAAEMLPQADIALFDSQSVSMGLGFCVLEAARMAAQGASRDEIVARLEQVRDRLNIFLTPATLRYLQSSGRVGRLQGALGALLNVKPVIQCKDGLLEVCEKVRTRRGSLDRILELSVEAAGDDLVDAAVIHANAPLEAQDLARRLEATAHCRQIFVETLSLTLGAHGGPGMIGIVTYRV
jgi:DegV family protein with EDD domain